MEKITEATILALMKLQTKERCAWAGSEDPEYISYHDEEWGVPVHDDTKHFEFLVLEGAQAGLSWKTILKRRKGYERLYEGFDPQKVAHFTDEKVEEMLGDSGIIRNRQKVLSSINNAKIFLSIQSEFGSFDKYIWAFVGGRPQQPNRLIDADIPASTELSDKVSADLKNRGMSFVGTTILYAHLQATGLVNDHVTACFRHSVVAQLR